MGEQSSLGCPIPAHTAHAVSVSLPTWKTNVDYEEGKSYVLDKLVTGYPRFYIHKSIQSFARDISLRYGLSSEEAMLFPTPETANQCMMFLRRQTCTHDSANIVKSIDLFPNDASKSIISAVLYHPKHRQFMKMFWQHSGEGISSRRAEYCHREFLSGHLSAQCITKDVSSTETYENIRKGPKRYSKQICTENTTLQSAFAKGHTNASEGHGYGQFVEERFGRNLDLSVSAQAKVAIKRRIVDRLNHNMRLHPATLNLCSINQSTSRSHVTQEDVHLFPCGMSAIYNTHRALMIAKGEHKSVSFGFPYIDTLKILEKFGPGCIFYGLGSATDVADLKQRCLQGERFLALFCEFPGNPLLSTPNLKELRDLADQFDFLIVVDETIGNFVNVHVLPYADIVVSSLTKVFAGEANVMGGCSILNPNGQYFQQLTAVMAQEYEDNYWPEDAIFMERNSRDYVSRIRRINATAEQICATLLSSPIVKKLYYPKFNADCLNYEICRTSEGGYGGLLSVTFRTPLHARTFFDELATAKGPSLGTNFTLSSPYVVLAHYNELEWAARFGVEEHLIRISVGLEDGSDLAQRFHAALVLSQQQNV